MWSCSAGFVFTVAGCNLNIIPAGRLDPNAIALLNLYPNPTSGSLLSNFATSPKLFEHRNSFDARIDFNFNDKNQMFFRSELNYSLIAYSPAEGYRIEFEGTRGDIVHTNVERPGEPRWLPAGGGRRAERHRGAGAIWQAAAPRRTQRQRAAQRRRRSHAQRLFADVDAADPYRQFADSRAGAYSIAVGAAANQSIATGAPVAIEDVLGRFARPEYPVGAPAASAPIDAAHYPFLAGAMAVEEGIM